MGVVLCLEYKIVCRRKISYFKAIIVPIFGQHYLYVLRTEYKHSTYGIEHFQITKTCLQLIFVLQAIKTLEPS